MNESKSFLRELEEAVARGTPESCLKALWHATDVLIAGRFSEKDIWIFGEVIGRLADDIEHAARVRLATVLAPSPNAPASVLGKLASDESIEVAGPVLSGSERVDPRDLLASARTKGQQHLLAIAKRRELSDEITDVLVVRGSPAVARSVVANPGARLSEKGFMHLLRRSEGDKILAEGVGLRKDISRKVFQQLIAKASDEVRRKLERERPEMRDVVGDVVTVVTGNLHARFGPASKDYFVARRDVAQMHRDGKLDEDAVFDLAYTVRFNETAAALSILCELPADVVERAIVDRDREPVLIMVKALGYCWQTAMAVLFLGAPEYRIMKSQLDQLEVDFRELSVETSRQVLAMYRARKPDAVRAAMALAG